MLDVEAIAGWFAGASEPMRLAIAETHLFGSVLEPHINPFDVDVVIVFQDWDVRGRCTELKRSFQLAFGRPLHIQMFHISQANELDEFLERAARTRRIM